MRCRVTVPIIWSVQYELDADSPIEAETAGILLAADEGNEVILDRPITVVIAE